MFQSELLPNKAEQCAQVLLHHGLRNALRQRRLTRSRRSSSRRWIRSRSRGRELAQLGQIRLRPCPPSPSGLAVLPKLAFLYFPYRLKGRMYYCTTTFHAEPEERQVCCFHVCLYRTASASTHTHLRQRHTQYLCSARSSQFELNR